MDRSIGYLNKFVYEGKMEGIDIETDNEDDDYIWRSAPVKQSFSIFPTFTSLPNDLIYS